MNLAVIGKITETQPIAGADRIRLATVVCGQAGKWSGVVGLDFEPGQNVLVFLQDAVLPEDPRWDFMARHKWRVRMARFKGVPSECVIVAHEEAANEDIGTDISERLGVTKYSKPLPKEMQGVARGNFPSFIPKTDEPNFQAAPDVVAELNAGYWVATLKCDGSSVTVWRDSDGELHVASRNLELQEFDSEGRTNAYWRCARKYDWSRLPDCCAMQFELVGPGIQKNPLGLPDLEGRAFTLYDYASRERWSHYELVAVAKGIGIPCAPVVAEGRGGLDAETLRELARVTYPTGKPGEGVVVRSYCQRHSVKSINLDYRD